MPDVGEDVVVVENRVAVDGDVEHPGPNLTGRRMVVGEVQAHLDVGPSRHRDVPLHLCPRWRVPSLGGEHVGRRRRRHRGVDPGHGRPACRVRAAVVGAARARRGVLLPGGPAVDCCDLWAAGVYPEQGVAGRWCAVRVVLHDQGCRDAARTGGPFDHGHQAVDPGLIARPGESDRNVDRSPASDRRGDLLNPDHRVGLEGVDVVAAVGDAVEEQP